MAEISAALVKQLRDKTGAGMMECKKALVEANGDLAEAETILRKRGIAAAGKKAARATRQGLIGSYIHQGGQLGVMIELNCESDFVARTDNFKALAHELALQVAGASPKYVSTDQISDTEREQGLRDFGSEKAFLEATVLMAQPSLRQSNRTIEELVRDAIATIGENIVVRRFVRYELGETNTAEAGDEA